MLGLDPFRHMFGQHYTTLENGDVGSILATVSDLKPRQLVLLDPSRYTAVGDIGQRDKTIALVGNGRVTGRGREIDAHDIVVRVNGLYNWQADSIQDGKRFDWWIGRAGMDTLLGSDEHPQPTYPLASQLPAVDKIISISHASVEAGFLAETIGRGCFNKLVLLLSCPYVFELFDKEISLLRSKRFADLVQRKQYHGEKTSWGGFWGWDLLLTGVRACVMLALGRPRRLALYGFDFYRDSSYIPWDMHNLSDARAVMECCQDFCLNNEIEFALVESS